MPAIASNVIVGSDEFRPNRVAHLELIAEFRAFERKVGEAYAHADFKFRVRGRSPPRERANWLLDRDSPFLELSGLASACTRTTARRTMCSEAA
jgi:geranyl-CoA carboxylase beta subunit